MGAYGAVVMLMLAALFMLSSRASADPDLLQDICVADLTSGTYSILFLFIYISIPLFLYISVYNNIYSYF